MQRTRKETGFVYWRRAEQPGPYAVAQSLTSPGETVLWVGTPDAARAACGAAPESAGGVALLTAAGAWCALMTSGCNRVNAVTGGPDDPLSLLLFACLSVAGLLLALGPLARWRDARATLYVVTDRRILYIDRRTDRAVRVEPLAPLRLP